uniref:PAP-associated domain-containing protein n=1 Tax=Panagrolaimus davidi TaxID=227884 RepID=A0A914P7N8_9BILA
MNGCGAYNSDMDICVVIRQDELNQEKQQVLNNLRSLKYRFDKIPIIRHIQLIPAVFFMGLKADININNVAGIYNTHFIHHYSRQDKRFPALYLVIHHFGLNAGINSAKDGTLNSYSLVLLVIHYLQCACQPPILPNLQEACPDIFNAQVPIENLRFFKNEYSFKTDNHADCTALLMGFFAYYAGFKFDKYGISIRRGRVFQKNTLPAETCSKYMIFIEDPFDHNNTARSISREGYERIKTSIRRADEILNRE